MKLIYLVPIEAILGLIVLFIFPEPESNLFLYLGTMFFFIMIIGLTYFLANKYK